MKPLAPVINIFFRVSLIFISHIKRIVIPQQADPVEYDDGQHPQDLLLPADEGVLRHRLAAEEHDRYADNQPNFRKADHLCCFSSNCLIRLSIISISIAFALMSARKSSGLLRLTVLLCWA